MGGCRVGGLAGATPLICSGPTLVVVSSPASGHAHPESMVCQSYVVTGRGRLVGRMSWDPHPGQTPY